MELDMVPVVLPKAAVPIVLPVPPGGVKVSWSANVCFGWLSPAVRRCWCGKVLPRWAEEDEAGCGFQSVLWPLLVPMAQCMASYWQFLADSIIA